MTSSPTTPPTPPQQKTDPRGLSSPIAADGLRVPIYTSEFTADPGRAYRDMRDRYGALAPVELAPGVPATLVIDYREALQILGDTHHYTSDPRAWQEIAPADCSILPLLEWRPLAIRNVGVAHERLRSALTAGLDSIDLHSVRNTVERIALPLIAAFCRSGSAELLGQYAFPLTFQVLSDLLGFPAEVAQKAHAGISVILDAADYETAQRGNETYEAAVLEVVRYKRAHPAEDLSSRLMAHPARLDDTEMTHQTALLYTGGMEPACGLILNTLVLLLTDERFGGALGGAISTRDVIDEVLFDNPPWANICVRYPRQPQLVSGVWLPAHQPVVISSVACNDDPNIRGDRTGNRSHLSWGAGPHACPAQPLALIIVQEAIDQLLDALPEISLAVPPEKLFWRPGPFHRALNALPVTFPATALLSVT